MTGPITMYKCVYLYKSNMTLKWKNVEENIVTMFGINCVFHHNYVYKYSTPWEIYIIRSYFKQSKIAN